MQYNITSSPTYSEVQPDLEVVQMIHGWFANETTIQLCSWILAPHDESYGEGAKKQQPSHEGKRGSQLESQTANIP